MDTSISLLGLGFEQGQTRPGLRHSTELIRGYLPYLADKGLEIRDDGDLLTTTHPYRPIRREGDLRTDYLTPYFAAHRFLRFRAAKGERSLNWGGDHSIALATISSFLARFPEGKVLWIDAHGDMNLPAMSPTGSFHGMPLALLLNLEGIGERVAPWIPRFLDPRRILMLGVRDLDPFEELTVRRNGLEVLSPTAIRSLGPLALTQKVRSFVGDAPVHVSFDIDAMDPHEAPSTGVPVSGGLEVSHLNLIGRTVNDIGTLQSMDVVEINPLLGSAQDVRQTMRIALRFLESTLVTPGGINHETDFERVSRHHTLAF